MIKLFSLVLDLLQVLFSTEYMILAQKLIEKPNFKIISFYDKGFIFYSFQDMLLNKISEEEFVALGDSFGNLYKYQNNPILAKESLVYGLNNHPNNYVDSFIILSKEDKIYIEKKISGLDSLLKKLKSQIFYL